MKYKRLCQTGMRSHSNRIVITYGSIIIGFFFFFGRYFHILTLLLLMCLIIVKNYILL